jgi:hypothetical protein
MLMMAAAAAMAVMQLMAPVAAADRVIYGCLLKAAGVAGSAQIYILGVDSFPPQDVGLAILQGMAPEPAREAPRRALCYPDPCSAGCPMSAAILRLLQPLSRWLGWSRVVFTLPRELPVAVRLNTYETLNGPRASSWRRWGCRQSAGATQRGERHDHAF